MTFAHSDLARLDFDKGGGLLPAIVQHARTGAVLMLGYMNVEALQQTLERRRVVFWSRSRDRLWEKGETSGNHLAVVDIQTDCDQDTLLVLAEPAGPVCHLGTPSCFGDGARPAAERLAFLSQLEAIVDSRVTAAATAESYTARLFAAGPKRMAQKIGEEGVEVALAAVCETNDKLLGESADLLFHLVVLLRARGLGLADVAAELEKRHAARG